MKVAKACQQCREAKRKCVARGPSSACAACLQRKSRCGFTKSSRADLPVPLCAAPATDSEQQAPFGLTQIAVEHLVALYLQKVHHRPHSLFHPSTLKANVHFKTTRKALLYAICSMGCMFSDDASVCALQSSLIAESKRLLQADLENICIENIQACILIANLCEWEGNRSSEALFFRIAHSMAEIMRLPAPDQDDTVIEREIKSRIWWTLYTADRWYSSGLGLRRQIQDAQNATDLPMDESLFHSLKRDDVVLPVPWKPGLWAHMVGLHQLFGPIQDLNSRSAQGSIDDAERHRVASDLARTLASWEDMVPAEDKFTDSNFQRHRLKGTGGPFISLHMAFHHYSTLLFYQFLGDRRFTPATQTYAIRCKQHAASYSSLLKLSREEPGCETIFPTVTHMAVVSSSVLLYVLLSGDQQEVPAARSGLSANFAALIEFRKYWPDIISTMIDRLIAFQNFCLVALAADQATHKLDGWMLRFLIQFALPLEEKEAVLRAPSSTLNPEIISANTSKLAEEGRFTDFAATGLVLRL